jgi:hypothetical protein
MGGFLLVVVVYSNMIAYMHEEEVTSLLPAKDSKKKLDRALDIRRQI